VYKRQYLFKLSKVKERMFTDTGKALAEERSRFLDAFYARLAGEARGDQ
jgi:hypothetical protein